MASVPGGKLGFLAEVDVPDLAEALSAIDEHRFSVEHRLAVDAPIGGQLVTAFNDIALVRYPGQPIAQIAVRAGGHPFVSYAADAVVVGTSCTFSTPFTIGRCTWAVAMFDVSPAWNAFQLIKISPLKRVPSAR